MQKFVDSVLSFQNKVFPRRRAHFERLAGGQQPQALFITCSDSRIDPALLLGAEPGDLFVLRNAGSIVPRADDGTCGEAATIEFAVRGLRVPHIVVCGHTCCAAVGGLLNPDRVQGLPAMAGWLRHAGTQLDDLRPAARRLKQPPIEALERHVLAQLDNLCTHPAVREALETGALELHGWLYHIERGEITVFSAEDGSFQHAELAYAAPVA
jgi:carbonic anhydrase